MNRKEFFKKVGLGALIAFAAPKLLAEEKYTVIREEPEIYYDKNIKNAEELCYNDIVFYKNKKYLFVLKEKWNDEYNWYTIRPLEPGKDVILREDYLLENCVFCSINHFL